MAVAMLKAVGVPAQAAEMTAAILVRADLEGHGSHGGDGIPVPAPVWASLCELATELHVPIPDHRYEEAA
jgi:LDH2 family malate/lactate/ureidoglycolate dehydrogenase